MSMPAVPQPSLLHSDVLTALGISPDMIVSAEPLASSISGGNVARLTLTRTQPGGATVYASRVLKRLLPEDGWLGALSHDRYIREVALRASGLLADLPAGIATATEAWALAGPPDAPTVGALLLRDERGHLTSDPLRAPPGHLPPLVALILDRLASMHAHFWNDSRLNDPALGLTSAEDALLLLTPDHIAARRAADDPAPYLPLAVAGWETFFRVAAPDDTATLRAVFARPAPWLAAIFALPWTLVHGDVWGPNLGVLPPTRHAPLTGRRLLLLDWALATAGPATYDPLWLCGTWHALDPARILAAYRARLSRHLRARGIQLEPATWHALADAAYLRTALTCGEAFGRAAAEAPPGALRRRAEARVRWWAHRAALAAQQLTRD
jgi:Phosphotransferase enzyme family